MKKQFLSLIVALFVTATFTFATTGHPVVDIPQSTDEFIAPAKLGMVMIQGQTVANQENSVRCKILEDENQVCVRVLRTGEFDSIVYINDRSGYTVKKVQVTSYSMRQDIKGDSNFIILDYTPVISVSEEVFKNLSPQ